MITRAAEAAIEASEISGLRPSIVGTLVISRLQAPTGLPTVETDLSASSPMRWSHTYDLEADVFLALFMCARDRLRCVVVGRDKVVSSSIRSYRPSRSDPLRHSGAHRMNCRFCGIDST